MDKKILKITKTDWDKALKLSMELGILQGELLEVQKKYIGTLEQFHIDRLWKEITPKKIDYDDLMFKIEEEQ